jgi:hypothetical protein
MLDLLSPVRARAWRGIFLFAAGRLSGRVSGLGSARRVGQAAREAVGVGRALSAPRGQPRVQIGADVNNLASKPQERRGAAAATHFREC